VAAVGVVALRETGHRVAKRAAGSDVDFGVVLHVIAELIANRLDHFGYELIDLLRRPAHELRGVEYRREVDGGKGLVGGQAINQVIFATFLLDHGSRRLTVLPYLLV
jgi:hypothetical protein